jgi:Zn-dependent protease with chaperone function
MPDEFNGLAWGIGGTVVGLWFIWGVSGWIWLYRKLAMIVPAPERLQKIAKETSIQMQVSFRDVLLMRTPMAQAFALPMTRQLLFTERLLELLADDEIAAICAHELAHLAESRAVRYTRYLMGLIFLPWIFINPLLHKFGAAAFLGLGAMMGTFFFFRRFSRKLESRADQVAVANEQYTGIYARALTRLYQDNLVPAVTAKKGTTHPHLYDRILAAGITPDFSRPAPADSMAWPGQLFSFLTGVLFSIFIAIRCM